MAVGATYTADADRGLTHVLPVNRDGFAVASGYLGLLSIVPNPITSTAAIACGWYALRRVKSSKKMGRGRAWFGIVAGILSLAVFSLAVVGAATRSSSDEVSPAFTSPDVSIPVPQSPYVDSVVSCNQVLRSLTSPPPMRPGADFITLMRTQRLPALPAEGFEHVRPDLPMGRYPDIDSYLDATPLASPIQTREMFTNDGYVVAEAAGFTNGASRYGAEGIQFRDSAAAAHDNETDIRNMCAAGLVSKLRAIPGTANGVSFVRTDDVMPYRAYLVIGNTAVHLNICSCVGESDLQNLADQWAVAVQERSAIYQPAMVDVPDRPSPTAGANPSAAGTDPGAVVPEYNLSAAGEIVEQYLRAHPGSPFTALDLNQGNPPFVFDGSDTPIGDPDYGGQPVVSTGISAVPRAPRRVALALPSRNACYYLVINEGRANDYGIAPGADAAANCFIGRAVDGALQVRRETVWRTEWPAP